MSFVRRLINVTFTLGEGSFGESGQSTAKLSGLRVSARIVKAGGPSMGTAQLQIYGMTLSMMNQLSTLGMIATLVRKNSVLVEAGDEDTGMTTVFTGTITNAFPDFQGAPEVFFHVEAHVGLFDAVKPVKPISYKGGADVATIMSSLATTMGKKFENNGVTTKLANCYFGGSARDQALAVVEHAGIEWNGLDNDTLAIWPAGQSRGDEIPLIKSPTLKGYPSFTSKGILISIQFTPSVSYGNKIKVESDLTGANGEWVIFSLNYSLDSMIPKGSWFSEIGAARPGYVVVA